jgi:hypothetical protein
MDFHPPFLGEYSVHIPKTCVDVDSTVNFHGDIPYYFYEFCKLHCGCFIAMLFYVTITIIFLTNSNFFKKVKNVGFLHGLLL